MPEDQNSLPTKQGESVEKSENPEVDGTKERYESDTQRIMHRHMENKDDVITDDDIRNIRVGMTPPGLDAPTEARFEGDNAIDKIEAQYVSDENKEENEEDDKGPVTPWDSIDPEK